MHKGLLAIRDSIFDLLLRTQTRCMANVTYEFQSVFISNTIMNQQGGFFPHPP